MKRSDKKIENSIRVSLTEVCEIALVEVSGFKWLTHFVNYRDFPNSLSIVCVFDANSDLSNALSSHKDIYLYALIREKLDRVNIRVKNIKQHVSFDTEEACRDENSGKWQERFK